MQAGRRHHRAWGLQGDLQEGCDCINAIRVCGWLVCILSIMYAAKRLQSRRLKVGPLHLYALANCTPHRLRGKGTGDEGALSFSMTSITSQGMSLQRFRVVAFVGTSQLWWLQQKGHPVAAVVQCLQLASYLTGC